MALFKILKGNEANLPSTKHEGWAYVTEKGNMYVDLSNDKRVKIGNRADTAEYADKATGDTQTIRSRYLARIKQVTSDGTQFTFRGETGDGTNAPDLITIPLAGDKAGLISNAAQTIKGNKTFANGISFPTIATWPTSSTETYPIKSQGLIWSGSSDNAAIFYEVQASDKGMLVIESGDDTNAGLEIRNAASKKKVTIVDGRFIGDLTGTADYASKAQGDSQTIRSKYVSSVVKKSGSNYIFTVTKGDGTTNDVDLYFAASASCGGAALSAIKAKWLEGSDTRSVNDAPSVYMNKYALGIISEFKENTAVNSAPGGTTYSSIITYTPWVNNSGGRPVQMSINTGALGYRAASSDSTWGAWKTIATTDGTVEYANKAKGDTTSIRSTYIASIKQVTSNGTTFTFRGYAGDGSEKADLISIPSATASKAGLVTTAAQTWAGNKTFNGDIYISHAAGQSMAYNTTNPKLVFSENDSQPVGLVYTDYDSYRNPAGLKVMSTVSNNGKAWFEVEGSLYVGGDIYDKENNILLATKYVAQLVGSQGNTIYTITPKNQEGTNLMNILNVPINLVGSGNTDSKIFLVGTTSQNSKAQTSYSHDTVFIDSDGFLYDSGNKPSYHSRVNIGNTNNYKYHRIAKIDTTSSWYDGTILLYISQDYNGGCYGLLRVSLRTNNISSSPSASLEGQWITRSGFSLSDFKLALYSAANKVYADLYYVSNSTYVGITVKQIQQGSRGSLTQSRWILTNSSEANSTTDTDKKTSTSYKDIAAAQAGLRGGVAYTVVANTVDASRVNNANYADRAQYDLNGNDIRKKYIATLAVKTTNGTTFTFKGSSMEGDELSSITIPVATASIAGLVTNGVQTWAGNKTLNNDLYIKGKVAVSTTSADGYNLYVNGTSYFVNDARFKTEVYLEARGANRLLYSDDNKKIMTGGHYANSTQVGINTTNTTNIGSHSLYVEGSAKVTNRLHMTNWIQFTDTTGLYSPNSGAGTHFYPNTTSSYGSYMIQGAKGGYTGFLLGPNKNYFHIMTNGTNEGLYNESQGRWILHYHRTNNNISIGSSTSRTNYLLNIAGSTYIEGGLYVHTDITLNGQGANRLVWTDQNKKVMAASHYASATQIGICITDVSTIGSYSLFVNGTTKFNGNVAHNGVTYFANGTTYSINNSADAILRRGNFRGTSDSNTAAGNYYYTGALEIRESNYVGNSQSAFAYAPRIGFHWGNRIAASLSFHSDGIFYFRKQDGTSKASLDANLIGNASTATALTTSAGNAGQPVYFSGGKPVAIDWHIGNSGVGEHNCDNVTYNFCGYYTSNGPANLGNSTSDGAIYAQAYSSSWVGQIAQDYRNGNLFIRGKNNGTWQPWKAVLTSDYRPMIFHWSGQSGQPAWLWGGNDGINMYVYNPSNFNVNSANYLNNPRNSNANMNTWNYGASTMYSREDSGGSVSNCPSTGAWWQTLCQHSPDANYGNQLAQQMTGGVSAYIRSYQGGTWSAWYRLWRQGDAVTSAVWNDYAECRKSDSQEPGYVMFEKGDDSLSKTIERLQHFAGIVSDTWGFSQGETADAKTNIAVAGRVLAYPYRDRNEYKPGDCVCAAPGGKVDIMTREEIVQYPDRIVGTVSCVPEYEEWGGGEGADRDPVKVNGRIWIKVK